MPDRVVHWLHSLSGVLLGFWWCFAFFPSAFSRVHFYLVDSNHTLAVKYTTAVIDLKQYNTAHGELHASSLHACSTSLLKAGVCEYPGLSMSRRSPSSDRSGWCLCPMVSRTSARPDAASIAGVFALHPLVQNGAGEHRDRLDCMANCAPGLCCSPWQQISSRRTLS